MHNTARHDTITDEFAEAHPDWVQWVNGLGWRPRVAGGATEDPPEGGDPADDTDTKDDDPDGGGDDGPKGDEKTLSQAEVDAIVEKRLGRERKAWEKEQADKAEKAKMTEAERLKTEKAEAEKAAADKVSAADQRVIRSEAKVAAVAAGVNPDRASAFLRVANLDDIEIGDNGEPDGKAIEAAVKATLAEFPEFAAKGNGGASGGEHGDAPKPKPKNLAGAVANHYAT